MSAPQKIGVKYTVVRKKSSKTKNNNWWNFYERKAYKSALTMMHISLSHFNCNFTKWFLGYFTIFFEFLYGDRAVIFEKYIRLPWNLVRMLLKDSSMI